MGERSEMRTGENVHDLAFEMAYDDVLTAWRVRNAALAVAATFVHPGPDGEDYKARRELVESWVSDGHEQVAEENHQRTKMLARMVAAEQAAERLRIGLTIAGKYRYACFADAPSPSVHHAVSEKVLTDCLWHGEDCDDWWMTVDPEVVAAASTTATPDRSAQVTDVGRPANLHEGRA